MRLENVVKYTLPLVLTVGFVLIHCQGNNLGGIDLDGEDVQPACDPDSRAPCTDDWFVCTEDGEGGKECEGQLPAQPDGGDWDCYQDGTTLICEGDHLPGDGGDWICEEYDDGTVVCRRHGYIPMDGSDGYWDCYYGEDNRRICEASDGGEADGDADGDSDGDGDGDENPGDCLCVPGAVRYCDTPAYCLWGQQVCESDGLSWGPCIEVPIPTDCIGGDPWYSPSAVECCVAAGFCCQDMWDGDHDADAWESRGNCADIVCE